MENKKERIKKAVVLFAGILFILIILNFALADITQPSWPSYNVCCEKTKSGAWCQNTLGTDCDGAIDPISKSPFRVTPTSCDATSFCKPGCCIDTGEGLCMENTPERVCQQTSGTWVDDSECNVAQCNLGCCILGDQASFVTLTRCKKLSAFYGLITNFKTDVSDETSCILLAQMQDKGACVYEIDNEKTCKFGTRAQCLDTNQTQSSNMTSTPTFYKDYLCSADSLGTNCGPSTNTICVDGKDEVYFVDTCGNPANIYDASKTYDKDNSYWQKIVPKASSCNPNSGNIGSKTCGNCQYFKGSTCEAGSATYGDNVCKDLNCYNTQNGKDYKNGESWCMDMGSVGEGRDLVGSRHSRHICINGEEITEMCADFRNEICIQNSLSTTDGSFSEAACRTNRWKDCLDQTTKDDCLNTDKRDCFWQQGAYYNGTAGSSGGNGTAVSGSTTSGGGVKIINTDDDNYATEGICLPNFPPGSQFWQSGDANTICSLGSVQEQVTFEKGLFGNEDCSDNCEMLTDDWAVKMNNVCTSLGDCGAYLNVAGKATDKGVVWKVDGTQKVVQGILESAKVKSGS